MSSAGKRCVACRVLRPLTDVNRRRAALDGLQARQRAGSSPSASRRSRTTASPAPRRALNPHLRLCNWTRHVYTVVEFTPTRADVTAYVVPRDDAERTALMSGRIPADRMELEVPADAVQARSWDDVERLMEA